MTKGPRHRRRSKPANAMLCSELTQHLQSYFNDIKDPRVERTRAHLLTDILMISILAVMAGAQGWEDRPMA